MSPELNGWTGQLVTTGHTFFYSNQLSAYPEGCNHYVFSQWWLCSFTDPISGQSYSSTEQFMMAKKAELFGDADTLAAILANSDPLVIKALGRKVSNFDEGTWQKECFALVLKGNRLKFSQNAELREVLLATGDTLLVDASPYDRIWGIGLSADKARALPEAQWPGSNLLGKVLTQVREELQRGEAVNAVAAAK